jgi:2,3-bisphosphoglycerate-independent phosphoglycerate mutase
LTERRGITGAILTTSDVHRGIAVSAGLSGETSPTSGVGSFLELGEAALHELEKKDFVYVHAQAEAELDAETDPKAKIKMVEAFDQKIVGPILDRLSKLGSYRVCLACGRPPLSGTPAGAVASVPYVFYRGPAQKATAPGRGFCEADAEASAHRDATKLINLLLQDGSGS